MFYPPTFFRARFGSVQQRAAAVGAFAAVIRRDLLALEAKGAIARNPGGASIFERAGDDVAFALHEQHDLSEKRAIGDAKLSLITPDSPIFLAAGTTVLQVARRVYLDRLPLSVFTNCLTVAQGLMAMQDLKRRCVIEIFFRRLF